MKPMYTHSRKRFARPRAFNKKLLALFVIGCIFLMLFSLFPNQETLEKKDNIQSETTTTYQENLSIENSKLQDVVATSNNLLSTSDKKNLSQKNASAIKKNEPFEMNLAGITAKKQNVSDHISIEQSKQEQAQSKIDPPPLEQPKQNLLFQNDQPKQNQAQSIASLPRSLSTNQPPLFAAESTMWNQPFVGFGLDEISDFFSKKYKGKNPSQWGEKLPGITSRFKGDPSSPIIVLTLDACGEKNGGGYDEAIIDFLRAYTIPATLFISSNWIATHRKEFKNISHDPLFEIAAHGTNHKPLSVTGKKAYSIEGTKSISEVVTEVEANVREIHRLTTKRPKWFRSGTAYYDDIAVSIVHSLGLNIAGYSIPADQGATLSAKEVEKRILSARNGDIILCHMNHPESGTREGILSALPKLIEKGYTFKTLSNAIESK